MRLGTLVRNNTLMSTPQLQVCKQQQTALGNKTCKLTFLPITWFSDNETWYTGSTYIIHLMAKPQFCKRQQIKVVYAYNLVVLAFLTMRLGTLAHNTTLMSKPHLNEYYEATVFQSCFIM